MAIAMIGDAHFGRKSEHPLVKQHIQSGQEEYFKWLATDLKKRNIKTVLFTGDIFDTRNTINVEALIKTVRLFSIEFSEFNCIIDLGNHDMYYENSYDICSTEILDLLPNVTLIKDNTIELALINDYTLYVVPWVIASKLESFSSFLNDISVNRERNILFGHFEMIGLDMEGGNISTFGLSPKLFADAAKFIYSGHYHGQSSTRIDGSLITYLGSPYPLTFANSDSVHGYWILNDDLSTEFIENTISPKFKTITDTDIDTLGDCTNSFVRVFINNNLDKDSVFRIKQLVDDKNPLLVRIIPYKDGSIEADKNNFQHDANKLMNMDLFSVSEMYIDNNSDALPSILDGDIRTVLLNRIKMLIEKVGNAKR